MSNHSLYNILELDKSCTTQDVKKAYMKLAKQHHPDKGGNTEKFKEIANAYEVLSDEQKRAIYDQTGQVSEVPPSQGMGVPFPFPFSNMGDVFSMFGNHFKAGMKRDKPDPKMQFLNLDLDQLYKGHTITINLDRTVKCVFCGSSGAEEKAGCRECSGTGKKQKVVQMGPMVLQTVEPCYACTGKGYIVKKTCTKCCGSGKINEKHACQIDIKPGMKDGDQIKLDGVCSETDEFENPGDIIFVVRLKNKNNWKRNGNDLETTIEIDFPKAILGCFHTIDHPKENTTLKIPPSTLNGDVYTIENLGMPLENNKGFGKLTVRITVNSVQKDRQILYKLRNRFEEEYKELSLGDVSCVDNCIELKSNFLP